MSLSLFQRCWWLVMDDFISKLFLHSFVCYLLRIIHPKNHNARVEYSKNVSFKNNEKFYRALRFLVISKRIIVCSYAQNGCTDPTEWVIFVRRRPQNRHTCWTLRVSHKYLESLEGLNWNVLLSCSPLVLEIKKKNNTRLWRQKTRLSEDCEHISKNRMYWRFIVTSSRLK